MSKRAHTRLISPGTRQYKQSLVIEESSQPPEQKKEPTITELDNEIECVHGAMILWN
jgi:hypothetical protein